MAAHVQKSVSELTELKFSCQPLWSTGTKVSFKSTLSADRKSEAGNWFVAISEESSGGAESTGWEISITSLNSFRLKLKLKREMEPLAHLLRRADLAPKEGSRAFWGTAEGQLLPLSLPFAFRFSKKNDRMV